jgi:hypothetical protein
MKSIFKATAKSYEGKTIVINLDTDANPDLTKGSKSQLRLS